MDFDASVMLSAVKFVSGDSSHICRLCFVSTVNQEYCIEDSVRLEKPYFDETISFLDMFNELGMTMEALLPNVICTDCATITINSYLFKKLCHYSSQKWSEAITRFEDSLSKSDSINTNILSIYLVINDDKNVMLTSKKRLEKKRKASALAKVKSILTSRSNYETKKQKKRKLIDNNCLKFSDTNKILAKHVKVENKTQIPCQQCAKSFDSQMKLKDHTERVHHAKTIQCTKCSQMFSTKRMLKRHDKIHHIAAICKLCFVQFPSKNALRAHLDKHDVNKCSQCSKTFLNKQTYKLHLKICGNPDRMQLNFFCDICNRGYVRKNSLRTHLKTDHGFGQVLTCSWCCKKFDAISRLKIHIVKHTKERNFYCEHCGSKFVTQAALVYHIRLHTGEKPFPCDMCDESFLSTSRRMEHKRRKHFEPTNECSVCHVKFVTSYQMRKHLRRHYNPHSKLYVPENITVKQEKNMEITEHDSNAGMQNIQSSVMASDSVYIWNVDKQIWSNQNPVSGTHNTINKDVI